MKSKKITTCLLLAASVLIWGTIAWRLVKAFGKEEVKIEKPQARPAVVKPDSIRLLLNYEDPFLKGNAKKGEDAEPFRDSPEVDFFPPEPEVVPGPAFKFKGMMQIGKKSFGLLDFNGETIMVAPKEKVGDFHIVRIASDKIVVRRQGLDMELFAE